MSAVLQSWVLDAPALSRSDPIAALVAMGISAPPGATAPSSDLVLSLGAELKWGQLSAMTTPQEQVLLQAVFRTLLAYLSQEEHPRLIVELRADTDTREAARFDVRLAGVPYEKPTGPEPLLAVHPVGTRRDQPLMPALPWVWENLVGRAVRQVASRFVGQLTAEGARVLHDRPTLTADAVCLQLRRRRELTLLSSYEGRNGGAQAMGFNVDASLAPWAAQITEGLDPAALLLAKRNFASPSWGDYAVTLMHKDALSKGFEACQGLAPLYYPPGYFSQPEFALGLQHGCLAAIENSPVTLELLRGRSRRYLTGIVEKISWMASAYLFDQAFPLAVPDRALGTMAGFLLGGVLTACAEKACSFLPAAALFNGMDLLRRAEATYREQAARPTPAGDTAKAVRLAIQEHVAAYEWLALLNKAMQGSGSSAGNLLGRAPQEGLLEPGLQESNLVAYAARLQRGEQARSQQVDWNRYRRKVLSRTLPNFQFEGREFAIEPLGMATLGWAVSFSVKLCELESGTTCILQGVEARARRPGQQQVECLQMTRPLAARLPSRPYIAEELARAFERHLAAYQEGHPLLAAVLLSQGVDTAAQAFRDGPVPSPARTAALVRLFGNGQFPLLLEAVLVHAEDSLAVRRSHSLLDLVMDVADPGPDPRAAVLAACRCLQRCGANTAYFERSLDKVLAAYSGPALAAVLQQDVCLSPEQEAAFQCWHPQDRPAELQALVQAARMRDAIRKAPREVRDSRRETSRTPWADVL